MKISTPLEKPHDLEINHEKGHTFMLGDSRTLIKLIADESIDCIITSPPYLDLKDYGGSEQIGYGQSDNSYYEDMKLMFKEMYRVAKNGSALWLVADSVKRGNGLVILPFELAKLAEQSGWKVHDLITWDKGKSLPWGRSGKLRGVCEQIILLGKGNLKTFNLNAVRDTNELSPYWIKYPERYNPSGKSPSNLWHFPIPVQGSWSPDSVRHDCPFPMELVTRMILLTTNKGDTVLDPFAGSGSVAKGAFYNFRNSISFDSSQEFYDDFKKHTLVRSPEKKSSNEDVFGEMIVSLRKNKIAIQLFKILSRPDELNGIVSKNTRSILLLDRGSKKIQITFLMEDNAHLERISESARKFIGRPPLSKYGIEVDFTITTSALEFSKSLTEMRSIFEYRAGKFYSTPVKHDNLLLVDHLHSSRPSKYPPLFSEVGVNIEFVE